jgi:hypothetical protein
MTMLQIESIDARFVESPSNAKLALRLLFRANMMGFLDGFTEPQRLDQELMRRLMQEMIESHVGVEAAVTASDMWAKTQRGATGMETGDLLETLSDAIEGSPRPEGEWPKVREFLDDELLSDLLHVSPASIRRYAAGDRRTPDEVVWRLHLIGRIVSDLLGSYNSYGVRRWFQRPRAQLAGRSPRELFREARTEDELAPVTELAAALSGAQLAV